MRVTANLIDVWGLRMQLGRGVHAGADTPGAPGEVVLSHHYWDARAERRPVDRRADADARRTAGDASWACSRPTSRSATCPRSTSGSRWSLVGGRAARRAHAARQRTAQARRDARAGRRRRAARRADRSRASTRRPTRDGRARVAPTREAMTGNDTWPIMIAALARRRLRAAARVREPRQPRAVARDRAGAASSRVRSALGASRGASSGRC